MLQLGKIAAVTALVLVLGRLVYLPFVYWLDWLVMADGPFKNETLRESWASYFASTPASLLLAVLATGLLFIDRIVVPDSQARRPSNEQGAPPVGGSPEMADT